jgi:hypothetical protein
MLSILRDPKLDRDVQGYGVLLAGGWLRSMQICAMFPKRILIMKGVLVCVIMLLGVRSAIAQERVFPIWPGAAPGSEKWKQTEDVVKGPDGNVMVRNITSLRLRHFFPSLERAMGLRLSFALAAHFTFSHGRARERRLRSGLARMALRRLC